MQYQVAQYQQQLYHQTNNNIYSPIPQYQITQPQYRNIHVPITHSQQYYQQIAYTSQQTQENNLYELNQQHQQYYNSHSINQSQTTVKKITYIYLYFLL